MKQFKISQIKDGKVFAKEVNPIRKPNEKDYSYDPEQLNGIDFQYWRDFYDWKEAENNLKEYELSGDYLEFKMWKSPDFCREIKVGQTVSGEIIQENGVQKIQL